MICTIANRSSRVQLLLGSNRFGMVRSNILPFSPASQCFSSEMAIKHLPRGPKERPWPGEADSERAPCLGSGAEVVNNADNEAEHDVDSEIDFHRNSKHFDQSAVFHPPDSVHYRYTLSR